MTNREIAGILSQFADMLDIRGESGFRVSAFRRGADIIKRLEEPTDVLISEDRLTDVPGIGKGIAATITEIVATGKLSDLETLQDEVPATLLTILAIPGVGPKTVGRLYRELGITNIEELEAAVHNGTARSLRGIGSRQEKRILEGIAFLRQRTGRLSIGAALPAARKLSQLVGESLDTRVEIAGSVRRFCETVGNIDLLIECESVELLTEPLESSGAVHEIQRAEPGVVIADLPGHCPVRFVTVTAQNWGSTLVRLTGSAAHLEQSGFTESNVQDGATEEEAYTSVDLPWIAPELREGRGEIRAAREGSLPDLVSLDMIRGDLHLHSNWSDGRATIRQLADRAVELGYQYLSISDHSHGLAIANGLDEERLNAQASEIAQVSEQVPDLRLFRSSEVEVKRGGELDFPDDVLEKLDLVVASLHSGRDMSRDELTGRLLTAIENPHVDIIAHPTGRIVEQRPPATYDWERVFEAAIRTETALEINANPARLDLPEDLAREAVDAGALIVIDSDAHDLAGLDVMEYGVGIARRGWVPATSVVNTWELDRLLAWLHRFSG